MSSLLLPRYPEGSITEKQAKVNHYYLLLIVQYLLTKVLIVVHSHLTKKEKEQKNFNFNFKFKKEKKKIKIKKKGYLFLKEYLQTILVD